jgi:hypothetical protein
MPPAIMFQHVHRSWMKATKILWKLGNKRKVAIMFLNAKYFIPNIEEVVTFEIEISKVWLLKLRQGETLQGDSIIFKELLTNFIELLKF